MSNKKVSIVLFKYLALLAGIVFPFLAVTLVSYHHVHDIENLRLWGECLAEYGVEIYVRCDVKPNPNYPSLGIVVSAGMAHYMDILAGATKGLPFSQAFRYYIALVDAINFLLYVALARLLLLPKAELVALALLIVPSGIVGGAIWGQVDSILLCLSLLAFLACIKIWKVLDRSVKDGQEMINLVVWLILFGAAWACFVLVKQLSVFSMPFVAVIIVVIVMQAWRAGFKAVGIVLTVLVAFLIVLLGLDRIFVVPDGYLGSSYYYVWTGGGSNHGDKISGNGFNIWMFLGRGMLSSSHEPFQLGWGSHQIASASPYKLGIVLYALWMLWALAMLKKLVWRVFDETAASKRVALTAAFLCLFHGLSYLAFNVLLSGTHERYMFVGYPYLLLGGACLTMNGVVFSKRLMASCVISAFIYGCFVFSQIGPIPGVFFPFARHEFVAAVHLILLIVLTDAWFRICGEASARNQEYIGQAGE